MAKKRKLIREIQKRQKVDQEL